MKKSAYTYTLYNTEATRQTLEKAKREYNVNITIKKICNILVVTIEQYYEDYLNEYCALVSLIKREATEA